VAYAEAGGAALGVTLLGAPFPAWEKVTLMKACHPVPLTIIRSEAVDLATWWRALPVVSNPTFAARSFFG
jgi:hypothetical protein